MSCGIICLYKELPNIECAGVNEQKQEYYVNKWIYIYIEIQNDFVCESVVIWNTEVEFESIHSQACVKHPC